MTKEDNILFWVEPSEYQKIHPGHPRKHEWVKYKGGSCQKCGYDSCVQSLTFHHIDARSKKFFLSSGGMKDRSIDQLKGVVGRSTEEIYEELDKCVLLCHNCHYELHAGLWLISEVITPERIKQEQLL